MKNLLFILIITFTSINVYSQTPDILSKSFLENMQSKGIENAIKYAAKDSFMSQQARIDKITKRYNNQSSKLGHYYGYEKVTVKSNDIKCFVIKTYILKFENAPAQINLVYYKPNDKWLLHNIILRQYNNNKRNRK